MSIIKFDLGETLAGKPSGNFLNGWDVPQPYTPQKDAAYLPPAWLADVIMGFRQGENLWIFGETGTGKTSAVKFIAAHFNWPVYEVTAHSRLEFPELCGAYHVKDGNMVWHDGPLTAAMRGGGCLLLNEGGLLDPSTAAGLNSILDGSPLFVPELNEYIPRHEEFRFVVTDNSNGAGDSTGLYQGVLRQNLAFCSRFLFIRTSFLTPEEEMQILKAKCPALPQDIAAKMIEYAGLVRQSYIGSTTPGEGAQTLAITMSPRDLIRWGNLTVAYEFLKKQGKDVVEYALDRAFAFRADNANRQTLLELKQRVFG